MNEKKFMISLEREERWLSVSPELWGVARGVKVGSGLNWGVEAEELLYITVSPGGNMILPSWHLQHW